MKVKGVREINLASVFSSEDGVLPTCQVRAFQRREEADFHGWMMGDEVII